MKKILALVLFAMAALLYSAPSYAIRPEFKQIQDEINAKCPMDMGEGIILKKIAFPEDTSLEVHLRAADLEGITKNFITPELRQVFRNSFLESFTPDNPFTQLCKSYNLKLVLVMYNPAGEEVFRETFKTTDFKKTKS